MQIRTTIYDRKESRTDNRRLAQWRVTWLIEHSTSHQLLWCIDSFVLRNPPLRQAPNRWWQFYGNRLLVASYNKKMRIAFTFLTNLIIATTFGQSAVSDHCFTDNNPRTKVSKLTYPFNKADRILLVKYKAAAVQGKSNIFSWDTVSIIPKTGNYIDTTKFLAKYQLTNSGTDSLLNIINQRSKDNLAMEGIFAEPSSAILFIDKKGNVIEYIVICFAKVGETIDHSEMTSSSKVNLGQWCKSKGKILQEFFKQRGVETVVTLWE